MKEEPALYTKPKYERKEKNKNVATLLYLGT